MSVDSDLRNLVSQTLETKGVLGKIRAELRASVFLALDEQGAFESPLENKQLKDFLETENGVLTLNLVREFLDFFHLDFTRSVFEPEVGVNVSGSERSALAKKLNLTKSVSTSTPLIAQLASGGSSSSVLSDPALSTSSTAVTSSGATFFSPTSRINLSSALASKTSPPSEPGISLVGFETTGSSAGTYHARSAGTQPVVTMPTEFPALTSTVPSRSSTASHGQVTDAAVTSVPPAAVGLLTEGTAKSTSPVAGTAVDGGKSNSSLDSLLKQLSDANSEVRSLSPDHRDSSSRLSKSDESRSQTSADGSFGEHSLSESSRSHTHSTGSRHSGTSERSDAAAGGALKHKYIGDGNDSDSASQVSSILDDIEDHTLTGSGSGSGSDSSWLSRPAAASANQVDTSDHSISQFSEGDYSYVEDVRT